MSKSKKKGRDLTADEVIKSIFSPKVLKALKKLTAEKPKKKRGKKKEK
jgi:hypothetical protein